MLTESQPLVPKRTLQWSEVGSEVVILDHHMGELLRLNPVASFMWKQLDGSRSASEIVELVARQFSIDQRTAERDAQKFFRDLRDWELVEGKGP